METPGQGRERPSQAYLPSQHANHAGHTFLNLQTPTSVGNQFLDVCQYISCISMGGDDYGQPDRKISVFYDFPNIKENKMSVILT